MFPFSDVDTITITVSARAYRSYAGVPYYQDATGVYQINLKDKTVTTKQALYAYNTNGLAMEVSANISNVEYS